jgi:hypothetical protein
MIPRHPTLIVLLAAVLALGALAPARAVRASGCTPTGFFRDSINMTAAQIDPHGTVSGEVNATGCNIGVYYDTGSGDVSGANIHGANYFGVVVNGDSGSPSVDVMNSTINQIGESPLNGDQHGVAIYYREFGTGRASGKIWDNTLTNYQKGGIVANGTGTSVDVKGNTVTGQGPVNYIAQNGIQIGYGASAQVKDNTVTGNSYTGAGQTASGGIIVVGGPGYGTCVGSNLCAYTTDTIIDKNTATGNDIGIWISDLDTSFNPPSSQTNIKVDNNTISNSGLNNTTGNGTQGYQAGIADQGNNDKLINNKISGAGYDPASSSAAIFTTWIDTSVTNRPKVHADRFD